jgi:hypothetical protein
MIRRTSPSTTPTGPSDAECIDEFAADPDHWVQVRREGVHMGVSQCWQTHGTWKRWPVLIARQLLDPLQPGLQVIEGRTRVGFSRGDTAPAVVWPRRTWLGLDALQHKHPQLCRQPQRAGCSGTVETGTLKPVIPRCDHYAELDSQGRCGCCSHPNRDADQASATGLLAGGRLNTSVGAGSTESRRRDGE